jgi:hypothetical protein
MASRITEELKRFVEFATTGFKYNLQVFPDTITAAALLFTLLFQSPPLAALSGSMILLNFLHPVFARFLSQFTSGTLGAEDAARCSGHFPGVSAERLLGMSSGRSFGSLDDAGWPSFYIMFLGFLGGYVGLLPAIYQKEFASSPKRQATAILGLITMAVVVLLGVVYRAISGCDTTLGIVVGLATGALVGGVMVGFLAWISERRITNILGFPLIRDKAPDGKPIYVCERPT